MGSSGIVSMFEGVAQAGNAIGAVAGAVAPLLESKKKKEPLSLYKKETKEDSDEVRRRILLRKGIASTNLTGGRTFTSLPAEKKDQTLGGMK